MIRNQDLAAEAAATRDHHGEQASRAMEDDLADAKVWAAVGLVYGPTKMGWRWQ